MILDTSWPLLRRILFAMDAEAAHELTLHTLSIMPAYFGSITRYFQGSLPEQPIQFAGIHCKNPIGLAAGLDKNGVALPFWPSLGFGFVEIGTVTAEPQSGNPKPRLFRIPDQHALINRMGFNNQGSAALASRLQAYRDKNLWPTIPVGVNIGKSKATPIEDAPRDYVTSIERLNGLVDWFTLNVSSPNTPGLRSLQQAEALRELLPPAVAAAGNTPVFLKLAPDLEDDALAEAVSLAAECGIRGLVATNTTISRPMGTDLGEAGGLSGTPLWPLAKQKIQTIITHAGGLPVIGVGGISTVDQVKELQAAGCCAIQLYSSLIFNGPGLPAQLVRAL